MPKTSTLRKNPEPIIEHIALAGAAGRTSTQLIETFAKKKYGIRGMGLKALLRDIAQAGLLDEHGHGRGHTLSYTTPNVRQALPPDNAKAKEGTRCDKLNALAQYGVPVQQFFTLPGMAILAPNSLEGRLLEKFPQACGWGAEKKEDIFEELNYGDLPPRYRVPSKSLLNLLERSTREFQFGDADFCGPLTPERRGIVSTAFGKMSDKGILSITAANALRSVSGGYAGLYRHHESSQVCLITELFDAAADAGRTARLVNCRPYVSQVQTMQLFIFQVRKATGTN